MESKSGKHLYSRGWFGLIPLIGGIVGIGLIFLGIFKYRDRKLTTIGFAALAFTVLIYSSIYYYFNYSQAAKKSFSSFAQPAMDNLIKNIEFYKTEHGGYPDSLIYLLKEDKAINIMDAITNVIEYNGVPMSPIIARKAMELMLNSPKPIITNNKTIDLGLTARETEILKELASGATYNAIGEKLFISPFTVGTTW